MWKMRWPDILAFIFPSLLNSRPAIDLTCSTSKWVWTPLTFHFPLTTRPRLSHSPHTLGLLWYQQLLRFHFVSFKPHLHLETRVIFESINLSRCCSPFGWALNPACEAPLFPQPHPLTQHTPDKNVLLSGSSNRLRTLLSQGLDIYCSFCLEQKAISPPFPASTSMPTHMHTHTHTLSPPSPPHPDRHRHTAGSRASCRSWLQCLPFKEAPGGACAWVFSLLLFFTTSFCSFIKQHPGGFAVSTLYSPTSSCPFSPRSRHCVSVSQQCVLCSQHMPDKW